MTFCSLIPLQTRSSLVRVHSVTLPDCVSLSRAATSSQVPNCDRKSGWQFLFLGVHFYELCGASAKVFCNSCLRPSSWRKYLHHLPTSRSDTDRRVIPSNKCRPKVTAIPLLIAPGNAMDGLMNAISIFTVHKRREDKLEPGTELKEGKGGKHSARNACLSWLVATLQNLRNENCITNGVHGDRWSWSAHLGMDHKSWR